jgi:hypothetical protein
VNTAANRRITLTAATVLLVAVIAFAFLFGVQAITWWNVKQLAKGKPVLWVIPQPLRDTAAANQPGLKLSVYGYEFEVPWADIDKDKSKPGESLAIYYFRSGPFLMFHNPAKAPNMKEIFLADNEKRKAAMQMWGEKTLESNFTLTKAMLETSPVEMSVFAPRAKVLGLGILLVLKPIPATGGETGIFAFNTSAVRGFQMGDPEKRPKYISVTAFDMGDHKLELTFGIQKGATGQITQAEVNRVLQTVRPVSKSQDGSGTALSALR